MLSGINVTIRRSLQAKHLRIEIHRDGGVIAVRPAYASHKQVMDFLNAKKNWIRQKMHSYDSKPSLLAVRHTKKEIVEYREQARILVHERLHHFNQYYQFSFRKIFIKNQKTRWGSCSNKKNLNFNYRIALLPPHHADYIIVHELCHLKELNHSRKFWDLVAKTIPDYRKIRKAVRSSAEL